MAGARNVRTVQCLSALDLSAWLHPCTQASDFDLGEISEDRNLVHLGRWSRVRKGYQGGWGRGPRLHFTCPMPPSAVADTDPCNFPSFLPTLLIQTQATNTGGLGQVKCNRGPLPQPPWYPFRTLGHLPKRILFRSAQICGLHLPLLLRAQRTLCTCCRLLAVPGTAPRASTLKKTIKRRGPADGPH
jgi:hypothetical protein